MILRVSGEGIPIRYGVFVGGKQATNVERVYVEFDAAKFSVPNVSVWLLTHNPQDKLGRRNVLDFPVAGADLRLHITPIQEYLEKLEFRND